MKKNTSSAGMENRVGPRMTRGGYVQILRLMRYESHGVVERTAIEMRNTILYTSMRLRKGR